MLSNSKLLFVYFSIFTADCHNYSCNSICLMYSFIWVAALVLRNDTLGEKRTLIMIIWFHLLSYSQEACRQITESGHIYEYCVQSSFFFFLKFGSNCHTLKKSYCWRISGLHKYFALLRASSYVCLFAGNVRKNISLVS